VICAHCSVALLLLLLLLLKIALMLDKDMTKLRLPFKSPLLTDIKIIGYRTAAWK